VLFGAKRWLIVPQGFAYRNGINGNKPLLSFLNGEDAETGTSVRGSATTLDRSNDATLSAVSAASLAAAGALIECTQRAGDLLYVPAFAAHATLNEMDTVAVAQEFAAVDPHVGSIAQGIWGRAPLGAHAPPRAFAPSVAGAKPRGRR
jgi:uncharacterized RmlC-like cupin family protein